METLKYKLYDVVEDIWLNNNVYIDQDGNIRTNEKLLQKYNETNRQFINISVIYSTGYLDMNGEEIFDCDYVWLQTQRSEYFQVAKYGDIWMLENKKKKLVLSEWVHEATICDADKIKFANPLDIECIISEKIQESKNEL